MRCDRLAAILLFLFLFPIASGCALGKRSGRSLIPNTASEPNTTTDISPVDSQVVAKASNSQAPKHAPVSFASAVVELATPTTFPQEPIAAPKSLPILIAPESMSQSRLLGHSEMTATEASMLDLDDVLRSVYEGYPLLKIAVEQRRIADGELLEAQGEFDLKLKGGGTTGPLGFYETNRFGAGFDQALFGGGQVFAGYRIGRGNFQPWYGERETNDGGEFKAGFQVPLLQNNRIDPRRAAIYRAALGRDSVEPDIFLQLIDFVQAASNTYWSWVAAGQEVQIAQALLDIAQKRQEGLQKRVERGDLPRIELTDNERLMASRRASLIETQRKLKQSAIKLSLFLRTGDGQPIVMATTGLPRDFPSTEAYDDSQLEADIQEAFAIRPELQYLEYVRQQLDVDLRQARNLLLPEMDVGVVGSQDVGVPASSKGDKSPFELEASVMVSVPLQRRKALGKLSAIQGKRVQVTTKLEFARDKISTEVQNAVASLQAAYQRIEQTRQSVELNLTMENAERMRFEQGDSNLLIVNLREQATADARKALVAVLLEYFQAQADYRAALASIPIPASQ